MSSVQSGPGQTTGGSWTRYHACGEMISKPSPVYTEEARTLSCKVKYY